MAYGMLIDLKNASVAMRARRRAKGHMEPLRG